MEQKAVVAAKPGGAEGGNGSSATVDSSALERLQALVGFLQSRGVRVEFFLAPIHPQTMALLDGTASQRSINGAERRFRTMAAEYGVAVHGSFDPGTVRCSAEEFYDSGHPRESCVSRIFSTAPGAGQ